MKTIPASWAASELAGKPNLMPFGVSPDFMNAQMNVLWGEALSLILPDTTYYEEGNEKGPELLAIWRQMMEKLLPKFDFSEAEIKDILDKVIAADVRIGKVCPCQTKKNQSTTNSIIPMNGQILRPWFQNCHSMLSLTEVIGQTPDKIIVHRRAFLEGIRAKVLLSNQLGEHSCQIETRCSSFFNLILDRRNPCFGW